MASDALKGWWRRHPSSDRSTLSSDMFVCIYFNSQIQTGIEPNNMKANKKIIMRMRITKICSVESAVHQREIGYNRGRSGTSEGDRVQQKDMSLMYMYLVYTHM